MLVLHFLQIWAPGRLCRTECRKDYRSTIVTTILTPLLSKHDELARHLCVEDRLKHIEKYEKSLECVCVCLEPFLLPVERCAPLRREPGPLQLLLLMHMHTLDSLTQCWFHMSLISSPSPSLPPSITHSTPSITALVFAAGDIKQNGNNIIIKQAQEHDSVIQYTQGEYKCKLMCFSLCPHWFVLSFRPEKAKKGLGYVA